MNELIVIGQSCIFNLMAVSLCVVCSAGKAEGLNEKNTIVKTCKRSKSSSTVQLKGALSNVAGLDLILMSISLIVFTINMFLHDRFHYSS